jgi:hypothetical protein
MEDWTIYNNNIQWQYLIDERKGLLLLAAHNSKGPMLRYHSGAFSKVTTAFWADVTVYRAEAPEPEMWELLQDDLVYAGFPQVTLSEALLKSLIAKGWTKK